MEERLYKIPMNDGTFGYLVDSEKYKILRHPEYNFSFRKSDGLFLRWGKTKEDDGNPNISTPEILDIEISTICEGVGKPCKFCYKSNTPNGTYMSFEIFKKIFKKLPPTINQLACGIGDIDGNPDMWKIFEYCRENGVIPNVTINGARMTPDLFDKLSSTMGAVSVSLYDKELTYNAVSELTKRGLKQTNIHALLHHGSFDLMMQTLKDIQMDQRLKNIGAIIFMSLKCKGNAKNGFKQLNQEKFNDIVKYSLDNNIKIGFDSCGSVKFLTSIKNNPNYKLMEQSVEKCESGVFSSYISCSGHYFPCSFCEGIKNWEDGIDVINCNDFLKDVWNNPRTIEFRKKLLSCNRDCPIYKI